MPILHSSKTLLREKLRGIEQLDITKRIGNEKTFVILISKEERDSRIPVISDEVLRNFIDRRKTREQSGPSERSEPQKPSKPTKSPLPPKPPRIPEPPESLFSQESSDPIEFLTPPEFSTPSESSIPSESSLPTRSSNLRESLESNQTNQPNSDSSEPKSVSVAKGTIDALIIREDPQDGFYAQFRDDDDEEEDTTLSRNLKKIRTQKPTTTKSVAPNLHHNPTNKPSTSASKRAYSPPRNLDPASSNHKKQPQPQQQENIIQPTNNVVVEHKWTDTEARLKSDDLDNTYRDFLEQKDKIKSSDLAKQLLKQLVFKCMLSDETKWFLDALKIVLDLSDIYQGDKEFWEEIIGRLQTKLSPYVKYKCKANHEYVRSIYNEALANLSRHLCDTNAVLTLPFAKMCFLTEPILKAERKPTLVPPPVSNADKKENSDPSLVLGDRKVSQTGKIIPVFQGGSRLPQLSIKREIKRERPPVGVQQQA